MHNFYVATSSVWGFQFVYPFTTACYYLSFSHPTGCEMGSHCGFDLTSQINNNVEQLFMGFLAICLSILDKCLFRFFANFKIGLLLLLLVSYNSSLYMLDTIPLSGKWFVKIPYHFVGCLFTFVMVSFEAQKNLTLVISNLLTFYFSACIYGVRSAANLCENADLFVLTSGNMGSFWSSSTVFVI